MRLKEFGDLYLLSSTKMEKLTNEISWWGHCLICKSRLYGSWLPVLNLKKFQAAASTVTVIVDQDNREYLSLYPTFSQSNTNPHTTCYQRDMNRPWWLDCIKPFFPSLVLKKSRLIQFYNSVILTGWWLPHPLPQAFLYQAQQAYLRLLLLDEIL